MLQVSKNYQFQAKANCLSRFRFNVFTGQFQQQHNQLWKKTPLSIAMAVKALGITIGETVAIVMTLIAAITFSIFCYSKRKAKKIKRET